MSHPIRFTAAAGLAVSMVLGGCAAVEPEPQVAKCDVSSIASDEAYAMLAPLGDRLDSVAADAKTVIDAASSDQERLIISGIGSTAPTMVFDQVMTGEGNNNLARTNDLKCKEVSAQAALDELRLASSADEEAFSALSTFGGNIGSNVTVHLVILGGFADADALADPVAKVNKLAAAGLVPDCDGWTIYIVGTEAADPDVKEFWLQYAAKCGANLAAVTTHLSGFPLNDTVTAADRSQITVMEAPHEVVMTVGGDLLFGYASAELVPDAEQALEELLPRMLATPGPIEVTGHTDSRGTDHRALSLARAEEVKAWMVQHGVDPTRITTSGAGADEPVIPDAVTEAEHAKNRRTTITITKSD